MIGLYRSRISVASGAASGSRRSRRSWPAQKARPAPVRMTARTARSAGDAAEGREQLFLDRDGQGVERVRPIEREGRDRVVDIDAKVGHQAGVGRVRELDEAAVDELEDPSVDRLVGTAGLLDDEVGEQRRELVVAGAERAGDSRWRSGRPTRTRPTGPSSVVSCSITSGKQDPRRVPAVAGVRRQQAPLAGDLVGPGGAGRPATRGCASRRPGCPSGSTPHDSRWSPLTMTSNAPASGRRRRGCRRVPRRGAAGSGCGWPRRRAPRGSISLDRQALRADRTEGRDR